MSRAADWQSWRALFSLVPESARQSLVLRAIDDRAGCERKVRAPQGKVPGNTWGA